MCKNKDILEYFQGVFFVVKYVKKTWTNPRKRQKKGQTQVSFTTFYKKICYNIIKY